MEDNLRPIYQERASQENTLGILFIGKRKYESSITDKFDTVLLVVVKNAEQPIFIKHYDFKNQKAALHIVSESKINEWLLFGSNRKIVDWILNGKIVFDRNEFIVNLRTRLQEYPENDRKIKIGLEFAKLIRRYVDGKAFFEAKQYLDAYNHIVHTLHHIARLAVIEHGFHPEVTVWNQVKQIEPEIYKLYEELVKSEESLEKRLELLFLATEFLIKTWTRTGTRHLLQVMKEKEDLWSFGELMIHPELEPYSVDLQVIIEFLVDKRLIKVKKVETKSNEIFHRYYTV